MEWTDISITVAKRDADTAEAIATMVANGGIYIEDYSDLEQQAWEIAHVDLIEQDLLDKPRDIVIVHMYLAPDENPAEVLPLFEERLKNSGIGYQLNTTGVEQEDWQNAWKKYYHAMDIGERLAIVPGWEDYRTDRIRIVMDPGMAFGTGTHETTSLCLETLDSLVKGGERVLDIGTGSGILAIAALKLGADSAEGVDIDPMCVRTAGENAARNGVADRFKVLVGDLSDKASGQYNIITANIVAAAILSLAPHVPVLMALGGMFSEHSGIINIALEGIMVIGGVAGVLTLTMLPAELSPFLTVLISVLVAALAGVVYSLLLAFASINLKADQTIGGTALNLLATAIAVVIAKYFSDSGSAKLNYSNKPFLFSIGGQIGRAHV